MHSCKDTLEGENRAGVALTINLTITSSTRDDAITSLPNARIQRITRIIPIAPVSAERLRRSFRDRGRIDHSCTVCCIIHSLHDYIVIPYIVESRRIREEMTGNRDNERYYDG